MDQHQLIKHQEACTLQCFLSSAFSRGHIILDAASIQRVAKQSSLSVSNMLKKVNLSML